MRSKRFGLGALPKPEMPPEPNKQDTNIVDAEQKEKFAKSKKSVSLIDRDRAVVTDAITSIDVFLS